MAELIYIVMKIAAAAVALLILSTAAANARWCEILVPPIEFQRAPTVDYYVEESSVEAINNLCNMNWMPIGRVGGCALKRHDADGDYYTLIILADVTAEERDCLILHEKSHLPPNNWRHAPTWSAALIDGRWRPMPGSRYRRPR